MNFSNIRGIIKQNYNLSHLTWFKVGGMAEIFFKPADLEDLILFLRQNSTDGPLPYQSKPSYLGSQFNIPITIIGAGSNIIIRDGGISGVVIKLTKAFCDIEIYRDDFYKAVHLGSAATNLRSPYLKRSISENRLMRTLATAEEVAGGMYRRNGVYLNAAEDSCTASTYKSPFVVEFPRESNKPLDNLAPDKTSQSGYISQNIAVDIGIESSLQSEGVQSASGEGLEAKSIHGIYDDTILLSVGAGCLNYNLAKFALDNCIEGLEFIACIPGSIGGGIAMNAGAYGKEFKDIIVAVEVVDGYGNTYVLLRDQIGFGYRKNNLPQGLIYTRAIIRASIGRFGEIKQKMNYINESRNLTQPTGTKTGGSSFANPDLSILDALKNGYISDDFISKFTNAGDNLNDMPIKAWQLIDYAGLRGKTIGDAEISNKHCNFMINKGNATAMDIENLGQHAQKQVELQTGIILQWEIRRIGNKC